MRIELKSAWAGVLTAAMFITGCTANSYVINHEPRTVRVGKATGPVEHSLVLGQSFEVAPGDYTNLFVKYVDGQKAFSEMDIRNSINFLIPAGNRTLKIEANYGNVSNWRSSIEPEVTAELQPNQVYQLNGSRSVDSRGEQWVKVTLEHLGSMVEYQAFRARNPGYRSGEPLTRAQVSSL